MSADQAKRLGVLFVCTGNICRSPTADGVFRVLVEQRGLAEYFHIDSAGLYAHVDEEPDLRTQDTALQHGYDLSELRGRQFSRQDFQDFDYIFAMDQGHFNKIRAMRSKFTEGSQEGEVHYFLDFGQNQSPARSVPDPYYGGAKGFKDVFDLIHTGCEEILSVLVERHQLNPVYATTEQ